MSYQFLVQGDGQRGKRQAAYKQTSNVRQLAGLIQQPMASALLYTYQRTIYRVWYTLKTDLCLVHYSY